MKTVGCPETKQASLWSGVRVWVKDATPGRHKAGWSPLIERRLAPDLLGPWPLNRVGLSAPEPRYPRVPLTLAAFIEIPRDQLGTFVRSRTKLLAYLLKTSKLAAEFCAGKLVAEVADPGEDHRQAKAVGGGNDIQVFHRSAGLHNGRYTVFRRLFDAVWKRKERIRRNHGSFQRQHRF